MKNGYEMTLTSKICCANIGTRIIFCPKKAPTVSSEAPGVTPRGKANANHQDNTRASKITPTCLHVRKRCLGNGSASDQLGEDATGS